MTLAPSGVAAECDGSHSTEIIPGNGPPDVRVCARSVNQAVDAAAEDETFLAQVAAFASATCRDVAECFDPETCNWAGGWTNGPWHCVPDDSVVCDKGNPHLTGWRCSTTVDSITCACGEAKPERCHGEHVVPSGTDGNVLPPVQVCGTDREDAAEKALDSPALTGPAITFAGMFCRDHFACPKDDENCVRDAKKAPTIVIDSCVPDQNQCPGQEQSWTCSPRVTHVHCKCVS